MELEPGEVICSKCDGETFVRYTEQRGKGFYPMKRMCDKCNGHGKLDWIENVTGVQRSSAYETWPDLHHYSMTWGFDSEVEDTPYKKSYQDIKYDINPKFKKQLERKIIKNMNIVRR